MDSPFFIPNDPKPHYAGVPQRGYATTSGDSETYSLFTSNVSTCFVVTLYDKDTKTGSLAHFDAINLVKESINKLTKDLTKKDVDLSFVEAQIIGGYSHKESEKMVTEIESSLTKLQIKVTKTVFTKKPSTEEDYFNLAKLDKQLSKETDPETRDDLIKKINQLILNESFTQIVLNTKTGVVSTTSKYQYLVEAPSTCTAYSEKSHSIHQEISKLVQKLLACTSEAEAKSIHSKLSTPIKKVFG